MVVIVSTPQVHLQRVPAPLEGRASSPAVEPVEEAPLLAEYLDTLVEARWLVAAVLLTGLLCGAVHLATATPMYQADVLVQVEAERGKGTCAASTGCATICVFWRSTAASSARLVASCLSRPSNRAFDSSSWTLMSLRACNASCWLT